MNMYRRKIELFISLREAFPSIENSNHFLRNLWQLMKAWCLYPSNVCSYWQKGSFQNLQKTNPCNFLKWFLFDEKLNENNKNGKTQLSDFRFDECALHESSSFGYLGNNQSFRTITLKRRFLICPALEFIFQGLESFVEYYSFFFSPLSWVDLHTSCDLGDVSFELILWYSW